MSVRSTSRGSGISAARVECARYDHRRSPEFAAREADAACAPAGSPLFWSASERFNTEEGRAVALRGGAATAAFVVHTTATCLWLCVYVKGEVVLVLDLITEPFGAF